MNEATISSDFQAAVLNRPLTDFTDIDGRWPAAGGATRRPQLWEVLWNQFDYSSGPQAHELLALLVRVAKAGDPEAQSIIRRAADTFARFAATEDEEGDEMPMSINSPEALAVRAEYELYRDSRLPDWAAKEDRDLRVPAWISEAL